MCVKTEKKRRIPCVARIVIILVCLFLIACEQGNVASSESLPEVSEEPAKPALELEFYALDSYGQKFYGFKSETAGVWYLFLPSTADIRTLTLYVSPNVTEVSSGALDHATGAINGLFAEGTEAVLSGETGEARIKVMQSELPSLHIVLNDATLDNVHADKDVKHRGNSVYLSDLSGAYNLVVENAVELKGRGNSTWDYFDKKGYQIKFDEKTSVLGMDKAKKWVLLANACDDSMMRTQLTYLMANQMDMGFVPNFEYVDLWINGDYRGTYIVGEKVELGGNRLNLEDPLGALFEHDEGFYHEEDYWFLSDYLQRHFAMKEYVSDGDEVAAEAAMGDFSEAVDELFRYLYSVPSNEISLEHLSTMIDVDSFVQYYLVNEFVLNHEGFVSSFYWYKDGLDDVIHLGPIWDFDTCMGNEGSSYTMSSGYNHVLFHYLLTVPEFYERTEQLKQEHFALFEETVTNVDLLYKRIAASAEMNYLRWDVLGKPNAKGGVDFCKTYEDAVATLRNWLQGRVREFKITATDVVTSVVSVDGTSMTLSCHTEDGHDQINFAVWSRANGTDDLAWYAGQVSKGIWTATVDLTSHEDFGLYEMAVYDGTELIATGNCYVERYGAWLEVSVPEDESTLSVTLEDTSAEHEEVVFVIWGRENGRDDALYFDAQHDATGQWNCEIGLEDTWASGVYYIEAYAGDGKFLLADTTFYIGNPKIVAEQSEGSDTIHVSMEYVLENTLKVWIAVWTEENGQDDLFWYEMQKQDDFVWTCDADFTGYGNYLIHVYSGENTPATIVGHLRQSFSDGNE